MKKLILAFILLTTSLFGEVVFNSTYNYWLYPLEGWELQPFEDEGLLSWFSWDRKVAFTINAWEGSKYSSTKEMVDDIGAIVESEDELLPFDFYGNEGLIGDLTFIHNNENHRGWFIFINGEDYDYYLYSFSFLLHYEDSFPYILSMLDSFGIGEEGKKQSGPVTKFYQEYGDRGEEEVTLDLFGYPVAVTIPVTSIENRNIVISREARIMESYSYAPELFYNAWKRYYRVIYRDNRSDMESFIIAIKPYIDRTYYDTDYKLAEVFSYWLQSMNYERRLNTSSDLISPVEAISNGIGDCDSKSLLLAHILNSFGVETILLTSEKVKHAIAGVKCAGEGTTFDYNNSSYLGIELTKKAVPGEIDDKHKDPSVWTIVNLEYDSDL